MRHASSLHFPALLIALGLTVTGCTASAPAPQPQPKSTASSPSTPLVVEEIQVSPPVGNGQAQPRPQMPNEPIVVAVKTSGASAGADLEIKLFELSNGRQAGIESRRIKTATAATTEVIFKPEQPWTPGRYLVEVKLDGKLVGQRDLDVVVLPVGPPATKPST